MENLLRLLEESSSGHGNPATGLDDEKSSVIEQLWQGGFENVLSSQTTRRLLGPGETGHSSVKADGEFRDFPTLISNQLDRILDEAHASGTLQDDASSLFLVGYAALHAFLQSNVTGPPLPFSPEQLILSSRESSSSDTECIRSKIIRSLAVDGVGIYSLVPSPELFCLAKSIFNHTRLNIYGSKRMRVRVNFLHQRLLPEIAPSLQMQIYEDLKDPEWNIACSHGSHSAEEHVKLLLERAAVHTYYGFDVKARDDINNAAKASGFEFALTGRLGKRTKFQVKDTSQLVVLARSTSTDGGSAGAEEMPRDALLTPGNLELDDDTLLESISFGDSRQQSDAIVSAEESLSPGLASIDPAHQPLIKSLDSIILLSLAASITNTSPAHGLTREETLPYASRVLEGGSTNWQIYTQALLVRSRIEGYKARTQERALLQLQALVDQVILETAKRKPHGDDVTTSFLPRPKESEAAPASERLRYIYQLCSPTRWELEAELAARWASLGGLKSALRIYERLEMWAEVALCWAGLHDEDKARKLLKSQLYKPKKNDESNSTEDLRTSEEEKDALPPDAPRYFCILGDIDQDPTMYERAWEVSKGRYARAQRSLGKYHFAKRDYARSADGYRKSLRLDPQNHASWFALGSARLQLKEWDGAVEAFTRAVQLDEHDAESWSNLGAALMERPRAPVQDSAAGASRTNDDTDEEGSPYEPAPTLHRHRRDALKAFARAATLKFDNWRMWENVLIVAASTNPPAYTDMVSSMRRITEIRGSSVGESCVDVDILDMLVRHITTQDRETNGGTYESSRPGLQRMVIELVEKHVIPLITSSRRLWQIVARLDLWRNRPGSALDASEKAWRAVISMPGWETGTERQWNDVVDATLELLDAYESLGGMERTEGLGAGNGQVVAKDWKFKARSAIRGVLGRGRESWEGTAGWARLQKRLEELKGAS